MKVLDDSASLMLFLQADLLEQEELVRLFLCGDSDALCDDIHALYEKGRIDWSDFAWYDEHMQLQRLLNGKDKWRWAHLLDNCESITTKLCDENF